MQHCPSRVLPTMEPPATHRVNVSQSPFLQEVCVAKIADDLYCSGHSHQELLSNWQKVPLALDRFNLRLSLAKTLICPASTTILSWICSLGSIRASPHRVAALASCEPLTNVGGLHSFVGSYKLLGWVLSGASKLLAPLELLTAAWSSISRYHLPV